MEIDFKKTHESLLNDFPAEAISTDTSRGFPLTSVKAAYVIERLNDTFGLCGYGWRYVHSNIFPWDAGGGKTELVVEVAIQYRVTDDLAAGFSPPVTWDNPNTQWVYEKEKPSVWSEPVFAHGGKIAFGKGSAPATDAHKSAVTDALTKAASMIGVAHKAFKGLYSQQGDSHHSSPPKKEEERPAMEPLELKNHLRSAAAKGKDTPASQNQRKFAVTMLKRALDGMDDEAGPDLLEFLWEERDGEPFRSSEQLSGGQAGAMLNEWLLTGDKMLRQAATEEAKAMVELFRTR